MSDYQLQASRMHKEAIFSSTGVIEQTTGSRLYGERSLICFVENVASSNIIEVQAKLLGQSSFSVIGQVKGTGGAASPINISNWDLIRFNVTTYSQSGTTPAKLIATAFFADTSFPETVITHDPSGIVSYFGFAPSGSATSGALWKIKKLEVSGTTTTIKYADGNQNYDNVWDNRESLTYS